MQIIQLKSTCCSAKIHPFGDKRRQCKECKRTWRIRPAKRGPKPRQSKRRSQRLTLERYRTNCVGSLAAFAKQRGGLARTLQKQMVQARDDALWRMPPLVRLTVPHILLGDALTQEVEGKEYTTYLLLARPLNATHAVVCQVRTVLGHESGVDWETAIAALPSAMSAQTKALVCDGHPGLTSLARRHGWVLQRCRFHVIQSLNKYLRLWRRARPETHRIHELVHTVVESANDEKISRALVLLEQYSRQTTSKELASILRGLNQHFRDYRSYIYYPELHLPATNNACECSFRKTRALQDKARGWRTATSHARWVQYALTSAPPICCKEGETKW